MTATVVFLGAGATKACNGPLTDEILPEMHRRVGDPAWAESLDLLKEFLETQWHVQAGASKELYPGLPLVMSLVDTALSRRQAFGPGWDLERMSRLREQVEFGIYELLEEQLKRLPTNNHWELLNDLFPPVDGEPCVISTNYDLIVDTALMFMSESRSPEGRLPDYCCDISTPFYRDEPARFGTLLKLHGSLNWLHCRNCQRMEIGSSEARLYLKILSRLFGPDLKKSFSPDGAACPTCGTRLRPLLIAPSHLKDYRNPHLARVWYKAEQVLREAARVVFVGYSLPDDDLEVVYLLKRTLARANPPRVTVVEFDATNPNLPMVQHSAGRRYRALFGDQVEWSACGLDAWLAGRPPRVAA